MVISGLARERGQQQESDVQMTPPAPGLAAGERVVLFDAVCVLCFAMAGRAS